MASSGKFGGIARRLAAAAAIGGAVVAISAPQPAHAIDTGAAVGIGLGSFALGTALGAGAAANPYYGGYPYGYAAPAPAYAYPPAPVYYPAQRSCWDPYYRRYYAC